MARERLGALAVALLSLSLGSLSAVGCHKGTTGGTGGAGGGSGAVDVPTACGKAAAAACARLGACLPIALTLEEGDVATCTTRQTAQCVALEGLAGIKLTAADLETCASDYPALTCDDLLAGKPPTACSVNGSHAAGSPCFVDGQCTSGRCGHNGALPYGACGQCAVEVDVGGACDAAATKVCKTTAFCGSDLTCHAFTQSGGACDNKATFCAAPLVCTAGACAAPVFKAMGDMCDPTKAECDSTKGLGCSPASMTCTPYPIAKAGASCVADPTTKLPTLCEASAICVPSSMTAATCVDAITEGGACFVDTQTRTSNCQTPMLCLDAKCTYVPKCG